MTQKDRFEVMPMSDEEMYRVMEGEVRDVHAGAEVIDFYAAGSRQWRRRPEYRKIVEDVVSNIMMFYMYLFDRSIRLALEGPWKDGDYHIPDEDELVLYNRLLDETGDELINGLQRLRAALCDFYDEAER